MATYQIVGLVLAGVLGALAALHFYWAAGGRWALAGAIPTIDGRPTLDVGPLACITVGLALSAAAAVCAARAGLLAVDAPAWLAPTGVWVLTAVFVGRAVGDFRTVGFFKRVRGTLFARRDSLLYSPLCVALATGLLALSWLAPS